MLSFLTWSNQGDLCFKHCKTSPKHPCFQLKPFCATGAKPKNHYMNDMQTSENHTCLEWKIIQSPGLWNNHLEYLAPPTPNITCYLIFCISVGYTFRFKESLKQLGAGCSLPWISVFSVKYHMIFTLTSASELLKTVTKFCLIQKGFFQILFFKKVLSICYISKINVVEIMTSSSPMTMGESPPCTSHGDL